MSEGYAVVLYCRKRPGSFLIASFSENIDETIAILYFKLENTSMEGILIPPPPPVQ